MVTNKKVLVLGMARSGYEAAKLLAPDNEVFVTDVREQDSKKVKELEDLGVKVIITDQAQDLIDNTFNLMVKNPGIKYDNLAVVKAKDLGIEVINEMELAFSYMKPNVKVIGVTGSNGKTTTSTLIYKILKEEYPNTYFGGNVGLPLCNFVKSIKDDDFLVLEISDHQLCDMYKFKTNVSVLLNITEAHTDFHDSHERYMMMKKRIFNNHKTDDYNIINSDNEEAMMISEGIVGKNLYFSKDNKQYVYLKNGIIYYGDEKVIDCSDILIKGIHNYENVMAAVAAVKIYNVSNDAIIKVLKSFKGVEHRIEYVNTIEGVKYYNDSKSTNNEATITALRCFGQPTLLIMGGSDRGQSFDELDKYIKNVKLVVCYGETKEKIYNYFTKKKIECLVFNNLKEATIACHDRAVSGDVVLLSPGCASWDQFDKFETRGMLFKEIVNEFGDE